MTIAGTGTGGVGRDPVIIIGGGIGGLATALTLHRAGIDCRVYEQSAQIKELGVGINTLPHAIGKLDELGLLEALDSAGLRTYELIYMNRFGQEVWRELRGTHAGHPVPQFSIHRGALQGVLRDAVVERLGPEVICTSCRLIDFDQDANGVTVIFGESPGTETESVQGSALIGADGIHSRVREALHPDEGPPRWNGTMLWRGATDWPAFLTGSSMIIAGGMEAKVVLYPIAPGDTPDRRLTNWAVMARIGEEGTTPPRREDWSRPGRLEELMPHVERFTVQEVDVPALIRETKVFYEYPVCDREPVSRWSFGRVTLLGDAAHPMYPVGSNGASQAILDACVLADELAGSARVREALANYENQRLGPTSEIVHSNRSGGPEGVIDAVEALAPDGFDDVEQVLPHLEREAIVRGYAKKAGFAVPTSETTTRSTNMTDSFPDVIGAASSIDDIEWHILGQTYRPMALTERCFAWHATLPPDTFVPPHIHPAQDEYVYVIDGTMTLVTGDEDRTAGAGDLIRLPQGKPHGLFNRSGQTLTCMFWVTPTGQLYDLFVAIDGMAEQNPEEVVALATRHEVSFLPPPE
jgi:2-polyprenyl-6-methoxyphenol hydroxylase-like FAD-dependent oxidoreductase/quercetin dioxygenase-like cupin family protein